MLSRTSIANHAAKVLIDGNQEDRQKLVTEMAAWLKSTGRSRQSKYLVNDIAKQLSNRGYTLITITAARELDGNALQAVDLYLKNIFGIDNKFEVVVLKDSMLVGGVLIDTPNGILDLTIKNKLMNIIKGASV